MKAHSPDTPQSNPSEDRSPQRAFPWAPILRPSPLRQARALDAQERQLARRRNLDEVNQALYEARSAELRRRRALCASQNTASIQASSKPDSVRHGVWGRAWQCLLTTLVHPAASWLPPRIMAVRQSSTFVARGVAEGWAKRTTFWANDEGTALLDGLLLAKGRVEQARHRPHIIVVVGFAMSYEAIIRQAKDFADAFDVVVVLHNSRGVGRSLGKQYTVDQAVQDCQAVIRSLRAAGHVHMAVYGISLGSATAFRAIDAMSRSGELHPGDIALAASVRGLSSIPAVMQAHGGSVPAAMCRFLLRRANLPEMDVAALLQSPLLATEILITTADNDWLVKGLGQLRQALKLPPIGVTTLPSGQQAIMVSHHGSGHADPNVRTPAHDAVLRRWANRIGGHA